MSARPLRHAGVGSSDLRAVARGSVVNFSGGVGGALATFLLLVVLSRGAGVTQAGLFFQAVAVVSTGAILCNSGAQITLTQRIARRLAHDERDLGDLVWAGALPVALAAIAAALLIALLHRPVAELLTSGANQSALSGLLVAMSPALPMIALTRIAVGAPRGVGDMGPAVLYDAGGQPVLRLLLCGAVAAAGGPPWLLGAAFSVSAALSLGAAVPHAVRSVRRAGGRLERGVVWRRETARDFWAAAAPRGAEEIFAATNIWVLIVLVGAMVSAGEAATYAAISRFTLAAALLMQAITTSMAPRFTAAFAREEHDRVQALFRLTTQWMVGLSVPVCVTLAVYPEALIHLVSPDLPGGSTGMRVMALAALVSIVTGPAGGAILFAGRSSWNLWIAACAFVAMIVVAVLAIPTGGADGASLAWAAAMIVQSAVAYVVAKRAFGLDPFSPGATRLGLWSAILSVLIEAATRALLGSGLAGLVVGVLVTGVALLALNAATSWSWWRAPAGDVPDLEAR